MVDIAKFVLVVLLILLIIVVTYKIAVIVGRFIRIQIECYVDRKNALVIQAEIDKTEKMLKEFEFESTTIEKARKSEKNFTGIL